MNKRKSKVPPEQGQLPLEFPAPERYDPRNGDEPVSSIETKQIIRDSRSQKCDLKEKGEKPASPNSTNNLNPFIDQFCEQVARIITKGKKVQGAKHESSGLYKGKQ
jgi:hypothetical protein